MYRYIAFLRAINVGGRNVKMDVLRGFFETLGYADVRTFIASGNVLFKAAGTGGGELQPEIERYLLEKLGYEVATFVRTPDEVRSIIAYEPFSHAELEAAAALNIAFLHEPLDTDARLRLSELETGIDHFHTHGTEVWWLCSARQSESKFSNAVFERKLGIKTTLRGLNTLRRLTAKFPASDED